VSEEDAQLQRMKGVLTIVSYLFYICHVVQLFESFYRFPLGSFLLDEQLETLAKFKEWLFLRNNRHRSFREFDK